MDATPRIFFFTPYSERGLGVAYNEHAALLPDDDSWGVFTDIDVMFFSTQQLGQQIAEVIVKYPDYKVFTCVTNRMCARCQQQIQEKGIREERDLVKLKQQADLRTVRYRGKVDPVLGFFAGYFIVFQKSLWKKHPFPNAGSQGGTFLGIDTAWSYALRSARVKVGIMHGLMATHFFRLDKGEADLSHLNDPTHNNNPLGPNGRRALRNQNNLLGPRGRFWVDKQQPLMPLVPDSNQNNREVYVSSLKLNPNIRPPCGYKFRDADGVLHYGNNAEQLVEIISKYRARIGRAAGNPLQEFISQVYARYPQCCIKG